MSLEYEYSFNETETYLQHFVLTFEKILTPQQDITPQEKKIIYKLNTYIKQVLSRFDFETKIITTQREKTEDYFISEMRNLFYQLSCKFLDNIIRKYKPSQLPFPKDIIYEQLHSIRQFYNQDFMYKCVVEQMKMKMLKKNKFYIVPFTDNTNKSIKKTGTSYSFYTSTSLKHIFDIANSSHTITDIQSIGIPLLIKHQETNEQYYIHIDFAITYNQPITTSNIQLILHFLMFRDNVCIKSPIHRKILTDYYDKLIEKNINIFSQVIVFRIQPIVNFIVEELLYNSVDYYELLKENAITAFEKMKKTILTDEELIQLLDEKVAPPKKTSKKVKNKKIIEKQEILHTETTEQINPTIKENIETTEDIETIENIETNEDIEHNKIIVFNKYEIELPFKTSFNRYEKFCKYDIDYINFLLKELYQSNNKFQLFIDDNEYDYVMILKNIHYDMNRKDISLHFNAKFASSINRNKSPTFHLYIQDDTIISITRLENILE